MLGLPQEGPAVRCEAAQNRYASYNWRAITVCSGKRNRVNYTTLGELKLGINPETLEFQQPARSFIRGFTAL